MPKDALLQVRIDSSLKAKLAAVAARDERPVSVYVMRILREHLEGLGELDQLPAQASAVRWARPKGRPMKAQPDGLTVFARTTRLARDEQTTMDEATKIILPHLTGEPGAADLLAVRRQLQLLGFREWNRTENGATSTVWLKSDPVEADGL